MPDPLIRAKDLVKRYDGREAVLNGVSFSVDSGAFVTIYGKSGCGKTTLLNIMGGLDRPTSGEIDIDGEDIADLTEDELARTRLGKIGFVFQDYNLLQELTIRENIELPLLLSKKRDGKRVDDLLLKFDIKRIAGTTANRVSGGEAQRAAIARAMANGPKIILADEPTGNLDSENTLNVIEMFQVARREFGTTVVLATHDKDLASHSSRSIRLADGKVVE
jgi:ABC-type lipoprotein export system ATPase subunit